MINGGPPGCVGVANPSGWMNIATFLEWIKHFIQNVKCSPTNPVLLLLDNYESHVSILCLDLAKKKPQRCCPFHHIVAVSCSHWIGQCTGH